MLMNELYQRERHADFVREAEQDRLTRAKKKSSRKSLYKPALSAVGVKLVDLGNRLQDNVETVAPAPMIGASKRV
jgi:hypothetical protein